MRPIELKIVSTNGIKATIKTDGSQGGSDDYYAIVNIEGFTGDKKIFGIDPIQSFVLGMKLIDQLTEDARIGEDGEEPMPGTTWHIEVETP